MIQLFLLLVFSAFLKFLSFPNFIFNQGLPLLAWFCYVPFIFSISRLKLKDSVLFGFLYGFLTYALICNWLFSYNFWAGFGVCFLFGFYWSVVFSLIKLFSKSKYSHFYNTAVIFLFEVLGTIGYLGFGYGVIGYTQWRVPIFVRTARITGVWGITFGIIFFNCIVCNLLKTIRRRKRLNIVQQAAILCFILYFAKSVVVGASIEEARVNSVLRVVLIQNNCNPWKSNFAEYKAEVEKLKELTDEALLEHPYVDLVVWPETAVVVDVLSHFEANIEPNRYALSEDLFKYINSKKCAFVIGSNYKDYNSAILFIRKKNSSHILPYYQIYSKNHLVPFAEEFPVKTLLAPIYKKMLENGNVFWERGEKINLLKFDGFAIGTPICFEDTFSKIPRTMKKKGAGLFVNLSNDSWSASKACQYQHLAMACFRSVENSLPTVRATNSGQTCYINSLGEVKKMLEPFTEGFLYCEVKINRIR
ncbi:apolipoprotein N-acyltransferase [Treponema pectinovorum]|uniref:apolipoprotein N-acyltransferase n=1 Tax=Treponema pectinovorum TaxID=164 RepID=UPI003D8E283C